MLEKLHVFRKDFLTNERMLNNLKKKKIGSACPIVQLLYVHVDCLMVYADGFES